MLRLLDTPADFADAVEFDFMDTPSRGRDWVKTTAYVKDDRDAAVVQYLPASVVNLEGVKGRMISALWAMQSSAYREEPTFEDAPETISEIRANRERKGRHLTNRDPAIMFLRDLDSGKLPHAEHVVVAWRNKFPEPRPDGAEITVEYIAQSGDIHTSIGLLEDVKSHMVKDAT